MDMISEAVTVIYESIDTSKKKHITGGILLSLSLLFGCLAVTVLTIKEDEL